MNIQSVAIASGTEAGPAEVMVKVAASAEATEDGSLAVKTGIAEDLAAVTETAETMAAPVPARTEDAAEIKTVRMEEKWGGRDKKTADRKYSGDRAERETKKRKKREEPGIGNSFPKRKRS